MRRLRLSLGLAALLLLWATPGRGAETLEMSCPSATTSTSPATAWRRTPP